MSSSTQAQPAITGHWISVIALALAAFIFNTTEFVPVALLSDIAESFSMKVEHTGIMLTIYAWVVSLTSLPLMLLTRQLERKRLLIAVFVMFILSHVITSLAWNFYVLIAGRIGIALSHAIFWSITASLAVRVAPPGKETQALGLLSTGTVLALVLGIPFGRIIGEIFGWRDTFMLIGILAALVAFILMKTLPQVPSKNAGSLASLPLLLKRPALVCAFIITVLIITAQFTAYSYIEPFAETISHLNSEQTTSILLFYGAAGIVGSYLFSRFSQKIPHAFPVLSTMCIALCLIFLLPMALSYLGISVVSMFWGIGIMCFGLSMQAMVLRLASDATDVAMAIYSSLYNVGIGGGALIGGIVTSHLGLSHVGLAGGSIAFVGVLLMLYTVMRKDFIIRPLGK